MVGTTVSHYRILEKLGGGGMGVVYKAEDTRLKRTVALKFLPPSFSADPEAKERFIHEAQAASALQHTNICVIHDIDQTPDGQMFICMEYYEGETLRKKTERGPLKIDEATDIASQIAQGLAKAHDHGIVHRDIKPANIMVTNDGVAKIVDFGLAKLGGRTMLTQAGTTLGTVAYMSPEQAKGDPLNQRSDIWSLGVVLYEMLTGQPPFKGDYENAVVYGILNAEPEPVTALRTGIPMELEQIVTKALAKDPAERYQHADEFLVDLRRLRKYSETSTNVRIPSLSGRQASPETPLPKRGRRKLIAIAGTTILTLVVAFLFLRPLLEGDLLASNPVPIAVISFVNQTGEKSYDYLQDAIPNLLITNLEQSKYLRVTTWERMHDLIKQMGKPDVLVIDKDLGFELCQREGIDAIVLGSFVKAGNTFATDVKVLDVHSKGLLKSANARGEGVESILKNQIDDLSKEISRGVKVSERRIDATPLKIDDYSTTSMEAYNYYLRGKADYFKYYDKDALRFLEKAIGLDSNFAIAYFYIGSTYRRMGNTADAVVALEKAKSLLRRTNQKEALLIQGAYALVVERDVEKSIGFAAQMVAQYPKEKDGYFYLGICYSSRKSYDQAIEAFKKALELDPNHGETLNQLSYLYFKKGDFGQTMTCLQRYASINPGDPNPFDSMGELYMGMGRLDDAITKYKEALEAKPDFLQSRFGLTAAYSLKEDYNAAEQQLDTILAGAFSEGYRGEGHFNRGYIRSLKGGYTTALQDLQMSARIAHGVGNASLEALAFWTEGWIYYERGALANSRECFDRGYEVTTNDNLSDKPAWRVGYCLADGLLDLKAGKIDAARTRLSELRSLLPQVSQPDRETAEFRHHLLSSEILLASDSIEQALAGFRNITIPPTPNLATIAMGYYNIPLMKDGLARSLLSAGRLDEAIAEYERLTRFDPTGIDRRPIPPKYHYLLAGLYEQKGMKDKAVGQYRRFLELWKEADKRLPELIDAKRRLTKLTPGQH